MFFCFSVAEVVLEAHKKRQFTKYIVSCSGYINMIFLAKLITKQDSLFTHVKVKVGNSIKILWEK